MTQLNLEVCFTTQTYALPLIIYMCAYLWYLTLLSLHTMMGATL